MLIIEMSYLKNYLLLAQTELTSFHLHVVVKPYTTADHLVMNIHHAIAVLYVS